MQPRGQGTQLGEEKKRIEKTCALCCTVELHIGPPLGLSAGFGCSHSSIIFPALVAYYKGGGTGEASQLHTWPRDGTFTYPYYFCIARPPARSSLPSPAQEPSPTGEGHVVAGVGGPSLLLAITKTDASFSGHLPFNNTFYFVKQI